MNNSTPIVDFLLPKRVHFDGNQRNQNLKPDWYEKIGTWLLNPVYFSEGYTAVSISERQIVEKEVPSRMNAGLISRIVGFACKIFNNTLGQITSLIGKELISQSVSYKAKYTAWLQSMAELENACAQYCIEDRHFRRLYQIVMRSDAYSLDEKTQFLVFNYAKEMDMELTEFQAERLSKFLKKQVESIKKDYASLEVGENQNLRVCNTRADGACGFHSIMGEEIDGVYYCVDIDVIREQFCGWLRLKHSAHQLPQAIKNILEDYFLHFTHAPSIFQRLSHEVRQQYYNGYSELSKEEQDLRTEQFIQDPLVFEAYLLNLERVGSYLMQEELEAVAIWQNLTVVFYQPGWGNEGDFGREELNPGQNRVVHVWYNGYNHYEHIEVV